MKKIYICHPYTNDPEGNIEKVKAICKRLRTNQIINPIAPHLAIAYYKKDDLPYDDIMKLCYDLIDVCDELWICSKTLSKGMRYEIRYCLENHRKPIHLPAMLEDDE